MASSSGIIESILVFAHASSTQEPALGHRFAEWTLVSIDRVKNSDDLWQWAAISLIVMAIDPSGFPSFYLMKSVDF